MGNLKKDFFCARHFICSQVFKTTSNVVNSDVNIVNIAFIAVCSLVVTEFAHWLMSRLRRRNKRYQNPEKAKTNGNCSKLSAASTIRITLRYDWSIARQSTSFPLRHWNLRNRTLQTYLSINRDFLRLHSTFARLYNAAASAASRLCSASSLAIIKHNFIKQNN